MPLDLSCVSEKLVQRLADLVDASTLAALRDKKAPTLSPRHPNKKTYIVLVVVLIIVHTTHPSMTMTATFYTHLLLGPL
jgi:hypothetical protein